MVAWTKHQVDRCSLYSQVKAFCSLDRYMAQPQPPVSTLQHSSKHHKSRCPRNISPAGTSAACRRPSLHPVWWCYDAHGIPVPATSLDIFRNRSRLWWYRPFMPSSLAAPLPWMPSRAGEFLVLLTTCSSSDQSPFSITSRMAKSSYSSSDLVECSSTEPASICKYPVIQENIQRRLQFCSVLMW